MHTQDIEENDYRRIEKQLRQDTVEFWDRFGGPPELDGKTVLEVGCGPGALSIQMAQLGAQHVLGIDIRDSDIQLARRYVEERHPELAPRLDFESRSLTEIDCGPFDLVVSKDSFEHIIDVDRMLGDIAARLAPGARIYIGFSPLYRSPYGDHDRRRVAFRDWGPAGRVLAALPWGHLWLERLVLRRQARIQGREIRSMQDLNLNKLSVRAFRDKIAAAGLVPERFMVNQGKSPYRSIFNALRKFPWIGEYFSYNVYCVLGKRSPIETEPARDQEL